MRDKPSAVTYDSVNAENEFFYYMNLKLITSMYKRSEYKFDMRRKHSKFTIKRMMSYQLRYRPGLLARHRLHMARRRARLNTTQAQA